jgi:hypothetical protein
MNPQDSTFSTLHLRGARSSYCIFDAHCKLAVKECPFEDARHKSELGSNGRIGLLLWRAMRLPGRISDTAGDGTPSCAYADGGFTANYVLNRSNYVLWRECMWTGRWSLQEAMLVQSKLIFWLL